MSVSIQGDTGISSTGGNGPRGGGKRIRQERKCGRSKPIVAVKEHKRLGANAFSVTNAAIARCGDAGIILPDQMDARIMETVHDLGGGIGGAVIDNYQRPVGMDLTLHGQDGLTQERGNVERRNDNGDPHARSTLRSGGRALASQDEHSVNALWKDGRARYRRAEAVRIKTGPPRDLGIELDHEVKR